MLSRDTDISLPAYGAVGPHAGASDHDGSSAHGSSESLTNVSDPAAPQPARHALREQIALAAQILADAEIALANSVDPSEREARVRVGAAQSFACDAVHALAAHRRSP